MKKVCIITGSRAEWGLFYPLAKKLQEDRGFFALQLIATGMHLSDDFGGTYQEIIDDGFTIDRKVSTLSPENTEIAVAQSIGNGISGVVRALCELKPDIVILLGDRFETFAAAVAAFILKIPIAHIHGGELTEGAYDDAMRHSITKMSALHFVSTEIYRKRVIQLGEDPASVFNVGAIGLDGINDTAFISKDELGNEVGCGFSGRNLLVTFHPVTLERTSSRDQFSELLGALNELEGTNIIFTKANADPEGTAINRMIDEYVSKNAGSAAVFTSMGRVRYLSMMRVADAVVGNSSSGIIEAPSFGIGTVNIGDRQKGRVKPDSVIGCEPVKGSISRAFEKLYSRNFQEILKKTKNPYDGGNSAEKIKNILETHDVNKSLKKTFYDVNFNGDKR